MVTELCGAASTAAAAANKANKSTAQRAHLHHLCAVKGQIERFGNVPCDDHLHFPAWIGQLATHLIAQGEVHFKLERNAHKAGGTVDLALQVATNTRLDSDDTKIRSLVQVNY